MVWLPLKDGELTFGRVAIMKRMVTPNQDDVGLRQ